jgi:hypothetical protein
MSPDRLMEIVVGRSMKQEALDVAPRIENPRPLGRGARQGYWNGHLAFVESIMTLACLQHHPVLSSALPQPAGFEQGGLYPTQWSANYDSVAQRYDIAFSRLINR